MGDERPIGVFDSGVGGISVLAELVRRMPRENYLYFGDSANAPYGSRSAEEVRALTEAHALELMRRGAKAIVIACNTATGAAIAYLREKYADFPFIGVEPAIKPAAEAHPGGRILVMATPLTAASEKFRRLMAQHSAEAELIPVPCPSLARMIEDGVLGGEALERALDETLRPYYERDLAAGRISRGFQKIAACMRGSPSCKRSVYHYKGWGLLSLPITPAHRRKLDDPNQ